MRSRKKIILTVVICLIIVLLFAVLYFICEIYKNNTENVRIVELNEIESIEIDVEYGYPHYAYSYKINFLSKSVLPEIDEYNRNETFYTYFTEEQAEDFVKKANRYGFFGWKELYERKKC